jgi:hypothetical protein
MPDPQRLLHTLRQAVQAFRDTPGRTGRLVSLADVAEILVAGDLHGHVENFRRLLQIADLARHPGRHLVLQEVIHGPYTYATGGDRSHQLVDLLAALECQYPRQVHFLPGNHEISQATGRPIGKIGPNPAEVIDLNRAFRLGVETAYGEHASSIYACYVELFHAAPLAVRTPNRVFLCHSLPNAAQVEWFNPAVLTRETTEADLLPGGSAHALVWGRDLREETAAAFLAKVDADLLITGHVPCDDGHALPNSRQLVLDAHDAPACYCLFPADRPVSLQDLAEGVRPL